MIAATRILADGSAVLSPGDVVTVLGALEYAADALRDRAAQFCEACARHPAGACEGHVDDLDDADAADAVAARLSGEACASCGAAGQAMSPVTSTALATGERTTRFFCDDVEACHLRAVPGLAEVLAAEVTDECPAGLAVIVRPELAGMRLTVTAAVITRADVRAAGDGRPWAILVLASGGCEAGAVFTARSWAAVDPADAAEGATVTVTGRVAVRDGQAVIAGETLRAVREAGS